MMQSAGSGDGANINIMLECKRVAGCLPPGFFGLVACELTGYTLPAGD